ncbi:MAG: RseA family anti-sigma factor [Formivibrio sp.]|nr:RseA family anti-sigma factor [Formivibrio sp.]
MSKEKLSALMDDELDPRELDSLLNALRDDGNLLADWSDWRLASDTLQGHPVYSPVFMTRFSELLAAEPIIVAPQRMLRKPRHVRQFLVPLTVAASVAFVGVAVWRVNQPAQSVAPVAQATQDMGSTLHAYLAAHRESDGNPFAEREVIYANFQSVDSH